MSYLVDTHCHLIFKDFREDLDSVINNAFNSRVKAMLAISTQENEFNPLICLLYTSPSPRDRQKSRMPSSA